MAISVIGAQGLVNPALAVTVYTTGSGTYTTPTGARYLIVEMCGGGSGGGGGGGNGSNFSTIAGGNGAATTFGTSLLTANGGTNSAGSGNGGSFTVNSPAISIHSVGSLNGFPWQYNFGTASALPQMAGGATPFGSSPGGATYGGGGYGGTLSNTAGFTGNGGGAGAYIKAVINSPATSYAYSVGGGGAGGAASGANNGAGGAGGNGLIIVTAYF